MNSKWKFIALLTLSLTTDDKEKSFRLVYKFMGFDDINKELLHSVKDSFNHVYHEESSQDGFIKEYLTINLKGFSYFDSENFKNEFNKLTFPDSFKEKESLGKILEADVDVILNAIGKNFH